MRRKQEGESSNGEKVKTETMARKQQQGENSNKDENINRYIDI